MNERDISKALGPVGRRLQNLLARGTVALRNAARKMQTLQVQLLAGETLDGLEHFEPYGFTSRPQPGAEVAALFVDGDRSHGLVLVAADRRYRLQSLQQGEVALHDDSGCSIVLHRGGRIEITAPATLRLVAPSVEIASDSLRHNGRNIGDTHTHGGVQPGGGTTSTPS